MRRSGAAVGAALMLWLALLPPAAAADRKADNAVPARDRGLLAADIAALAPQQRGQVDLYVVGFAGDATEDVFRNEVAYLDTLMSRRFATDARVLTLINHPDSLGAAPRPLATLANLRTALAGVGRVMDRDEDILLLYLTMHGAQDHQLVVQTPSAAQEWITPDALRAALDASGIRHRVLVISACFSGGFVPALSAPGTMVITAARADRPSFGCGAESQATYFGRAWLVHGLNRSTSFIGAYDLATREIIRRERGQGERPSLPQIDIGTEITAPLQAWQSRLEAGAAVPYPYPDSAD